MSGVAMQRIDEKLNNTLREYSPIWEKFLFTQDLIFQSFNITKISPMYTIENIIQTELDFRVLDMLESVKYSYYAVNAKSLIYDMWDKRKTLFNTENVEENYLDLKYVYHFYEKYNFNTIDTFHIDVPYYAKETAIIKNVFRGNNYIKNLSSEFFSEYGTSLTNIGYYKKDGKYMIPVYSAATLLQKFAIEKMGVQEKFFIHKKNTLNVSELENTDISCKAAMYWQYYKNTRYLGLNKQRIKEYYIHLLFDLDFLTRISLSVYPEFLITDEFNGTKCTLNGLIAQPFFDDEIIFKYNNSELPDYFIFVYHALIMYIANNQKYPLPNFYSQLLNLRKDIFQLMNISLTPLVQDRFYSLLKKHDNNINAAEEYLVAQLDSYVDCENHYNITPTK